jgi:23S rRNA (uracil1939-C5)-methyltransferase
MRDGDQVEVRIDDGLDTEARGVGHTVDGAYNVRLPGALPGERLHAKIVHVGKKRNLYAEPAEVIEASPDRVPVGCPHFLVCGGCDFLHLNLRAQHDYKRRRVADALDLPIERIDPVLASPRNQGYRALAKLVLGPRRILGSYKPRSHEVADMAGCLIHAPETERVVDAIRATLRECPEPIDLRYVLVRASIAAKKCLVSLVAREPDAAAPRWLADRIRLRDDVEKIVLNVNRSETDALLGPGPDLVLFDRGGVLHESIGPVSQAIEVGAFAQVNPLAAAELYRAVTEAFEPRGKTILDLYSGSGGIALTLGSSGAARVVGVEANEDAVRAAAASAESMGLGSVVELQSVSVEQGLEQISERFDAIVLNPPRKGASFEALAAIAQRAPIRVVYVSCNPESLARDLEILRGRAKLEIVRVQPVDLFPETRHVETVVVAQLG